MRVERRGEKEGKGNSIVEGERSERSGVREGAGRRGGVARIVGGVRWVLFRAIYPVVGVGGETMGVGRGKGEGGWWRRERLLALGGWRCRARAKGGRKCLLICFERREEVQPGERKMERSRPFSRLTDGSGEVAVGPSGKVNWRAG